jgi:hypothetical protein
MFMVKAALEWISKNYELLVTFAKDNPILSLIVLVTLLNSTAIIQYYYQLSDFPAVNPSFNASWPDAIRCKWTEPEAQVQSDLIFYTKGRAASRGGVGTVIVYFLTGGHNDSFGYYPHEIWFNESSKVLIRPETIPDANLDGHGRRYKAAFLHNIDCGGDALDKVKSSQNAFYFARQAR